MEVVKLLHRKAKYSSSVADISKLRMTTIYPTGGTFHATTQFYIFLTKLKELPRLPCAV